MDGFEERKRKQQAHLAEEAAQQLLDNAALIAGFQQLCLARGISLADNEFSYIPQIGILAIHPGLITFLHPDLSIDKDELYDFQQLSQGYSKRRYAPGYLYSEQYMLMAHPYFRRGCHAAATFSPRFLDVFWQLDAPLIQQYISLDPDRVRINVDNSMYMEKDTWYGAKFNKDIRSIPDGLVKLAPPTDLERVHISFFFNDVCALDIKWSTQGGIKSFYAEEFNTEKVTVCINGFDFHPARYIHAEFDLNEETFRHFDGALHFYTPDDYADRVFSDFNYNAKNNHPIKSQSQKLFRVDGEVPIDMWMELVSQFFTGNPLVFEYFEGAYPKHITEMIQTVRNNKTS